LGVQKLTALLEVALFLKKCDMDEKPKASFEAMKMVVDIASSKIESNGPFDLSFVIDIFHDRFNGNEF
jgi:hypothetical protein